MSKLDITSTTVEKLIDVAKDFLAKLLTPAVEETGLLIKDHVSFWRFNNQLKMLVRAKEKCEKNGIKPKNISLKLLVPLLEYSGLEEDEEMADNWSNLLSNMVDSEQNIQDHVFPYILSQISKKEIKSLHRNYDEMVLESERKKKQLIKDQTVIKTINVLERNLKKYEEFLEVSKKHQTLKMQIKKVKKAIDQQKAGILFLTTNERNGIDTDLIEPFEIDFEEIEEFEIFNLIRLGLIKEEKKIMAETIQIETSRLFGGNSNKLETKINTTERYYLSELGRKFIKACKEKNVQKII